MTIHALKRTLKRAEQVKDLIEGIQSAFQVNLGGVSTRKEFTDCRITTHSARYESADLVVRLTYDGAGFDFWSYDAEFKFGLRDSLSEGLKRIDKDLFFEDCNSWSLEIYLER